jgi:hypothetical protein
MPPDPTGEAVPDADARAATPTQREELTELKKPGEDKVEDKVNIFKHPWPTTKSHPKLMPSKLE